MAAKCVLAISACPARQECFGEKSFSSSPFRRQIRRLDPQWLGANLVDFTKEDSLAILLPFLQKMNGTLLHARYKTVHFGICWLTRRNDGAAECQNSLPQAKHLPAI